MDFTINEWAIIALVFVLGWLLGLASRGDRRWRQKYEQERTAHEALRRDHDTRVAAANRRITELERQERPVPIAAPVPSAASTRPAVASAAAAAVATTPTARGDDLTRIIGIDAQEERRLNDAGIHSYRELAALSQADATELETRLGYDAGRIDGERWREQAALLSNGRAADRDGPGIDPEPRRT